MPKLAKKNGFDIKIKFYGDWKRIRILNKQLEKRFKAFNKLFLQHSAKWYAKELISKAPVELVKSYKDGIRFYELSKPLKFDRRDNEAVLLAVEPSVKRGLIKFDPETTIIFVDIYQHASFISEITMFLKNNSPWTVDTIPLIPTIKDGAVVRYRTASADEVKIIRDNKVKNYTNIKNFFDRKGIKIPIKEFPKMAEFRDDIAMKALRYEFGLAGTKKKPHWRITSRDYLREGIYKIMGNRLLIKTLFDSGFSAWKNIPKFEKTTPAMIYAGREFMSKIKVNVLPRKPGENEKVLEKRLKEIKKWKVA